MLQRPGSQRLKHMKAMAVQGPHDEPRKVLNADEFRAAQIASRAFHQRILAPVWRRLLRVTVRYAPTRIITTLQRQLDRAGNPPSLGAHSLLTVKVGLGVLGLVGG